MTLRPRESWTQSHLVQNRRETGFVVILHSLFYLAVLMIPPGPGKIDIIAIRELIHAES